MYKHIILFKFSSSLSERFCLDLLDTLGQLQSAIPQIKGHHYSKNDPDNPHNQHFDYAFVMSFANKRDRYIYQNHASHQAFIQNQLEPVIEDAIVFDLDAPL
jgi:hypothetical protein